NDYIGVAGVQFQLDGNALGMEDTVSAFSINWNTTQIANGSHTLRAVARDAAGNSTTSAGVVVTVNNTVTNNGPDVVPPVVSITAPQPGEALSGLVTVSASASNNTAVAGVQFAVDGVNLGAEDTIVPYSAVWDTTKATDGTTN